MIANRYNPFSYMAAFLVQQSSDIFVIYSFFLCRFFTIVRYPLFEI